MGDGRKPVKSRPPLTPEYCERQYNVRAAIPGHPQIFARWKDASREARRTLSCALDVAYGSGPDETLDIFYARGESRALLTFLHGGFWRALHRTIFPSSRARLSSGT